jgi:cytoskeletal protein RodZ
MNEHGVWASWLGEGPTLFIVLALVLLNIIFLYVAWVQKRQRRKAERDLLAVQTFGSASPFAAKRPLNNEKSSLQTQTNKTDADDVSLLKIDKAIVMLKKGSSLEEIKTALDIETSYLKILATHHTR